MAKSAALLMAAALLFLAYYPAEAQETAGNACQAVLISGLYSTFRNSYSEIHQAACADYWMWDYPYEQYREDTATPEAQGLAASLNIAVKAFRWVVGGTYTGSRYIQSAAQFAVVRMESEAYRATSCGSSLVNSSTDNAVIILAQFVDPAIYQAYISCINLFTSGLRITQTSAFTYRRVSLEVRFIPTQARPSAFITGIVAYPPNTAQCTIYQTPPAAEPAAAAVPVVQAAASPPPAGTRRPSPLPPPRPLPPRPRPPSPSPPSPPITSPPASPFQLLPRTVYSVFCQMSPDVPSDLRYTDINVYTSSGNFHTLVYSDPDPPANQLTEVFNRIGALETWLQANISNLSNKASGQASPAHAAVRGGSSRYPSNACCRSENSCRNSHEMFERNNVVQQRASNVQTGFYQVNFGCSEANNWGCTGGASKSKVFSVNFPSSSFASTPVVTLAINGMDGPKTQDNVQRIRTTIISSNRTGFIGEVTAWMLDQGCFCLIDLTWVAVAKDVLNL
ncbi:hypothetical protein VOLCADRAFT_106592 [Volvox carteri f. nagariensis]|uniref:Uncharacterized protein n=1 Tax=Volvox carteri f. nagariensis TaxID=3068 RepID=D8U8E8_VOLCA|nr:uncharacterized protein VOLCADRAFT_106592 [Volvox carteri f. nagariensis]EFJ43915.1 hypothetical protein VOLCADRAFT_106592 [Volvox carteri f. nagariensis]|eukprot:XP_002954927.1 hypothetical protein VOLCADRAFT_106592 [Volvox carteri f. nagariensis]